MSFNFILTALASILFSSMALGIDHSLIDAYRPKPTDKLDTIQDLLDIPLKSLYSISETVNGTSQSVIMSQNCSSSFDHFSETVVNFTRCAVKYARPIHICMECKNDYKASVKAYGNLKKQGSECDSFFFSSDQLGIVDVIYNGAKDLWEKSFCQNCYDHYNETQIFFQASNELQQCIKNSNESVFMNSTCEKCHFNYANLSQSYDKFVKWKREYEGGICMDVVDTMNITRRIWIENKCVSQFDTAIGFTNVLTALTVGATPVMFYALAKNVARLEDVKLVRPKRKFTTQAAPDQ